MKGEQFIEERSHKCLHKKECIIEKEARVYSIKVRYIRLSSPIRDIFQVPIFLHMPILITVLRKRTASCLYEVTCCSSYCPTVVNNIQTTNLCPVDTNAVYVSKRIICFQLKLKFL